MWQKIKNIYHFLVAALANFYYGFPSKKIKVIGVTGTDGKTTTTNLIAHILKENGKKVSFISTVYAQVAGKVYDVGLHVTTPSSFMIQKFLHQAVTNGNEYFVLETTSHALDQNRVWGVSYQIGVITNITHEHLDYHKNYLNYLKTKEKLLWMAKKGVVNFKGKEFKYFDKKLKNKLFDYYPKIKIIKKYFPNLEKFNQENYAAALTVCKLLGLSEFEIVSAMKSFQLPKGRLDVVYDKEFKVIIDFAHTPNAFAQLLPEIRKKYLKNNGRLIHVFGSAGLRDPFKRPKMGEISSRFSDYIILTEEDYRTEKLVDICNQIASGIKKTAYKIIEKRDEAIKQAILMAKKDDVVVLTGKAHEKSLCRGKIEYPWDEHQAVERALEIKK
ncbi:MAG: Mur ligase family protein [Microgenomates group bacterium]